MCASLLLGAISVISRSRLREIHSDVSPKALPARRFPFLIAAAEVRFAAQGLLGNERIRSDRTSVNLVVDQMGQLEHVDEADRDLLLEGLAGHAVIQIGLAIVREAGGLELCLDLGLHGAVEDGR